MSNFSAISSPFTPETADLFLKQFVCQENELQITAEERSKIRAALTVLTNLSDYQMLGICADNFNQAMNALEHYLLGLGYEVNLNIENSLQVQNSVYLKYNTRKHAHLLDTYVGEYRGVLISFQSDYADGVFGTYGHFPFDLFDPQA